MPAGAWPGSTDGLVEATETDGAPAGHGGWAWYAHGHLAPDTRYRVANVDTAANCWDSPGERHIDAPRLR